MTVVLLVVAVLAPGCLHVRAVLPPEPPFLRSRRGDRSPPAASGRRVTGGELSFRRVTGSCQGFPETLAPSTLDSYAAWRIARCTRSGAPPPRPVSRAVAASADHLERRIESACPPTLHPCPPLTADQVAYTRDASPTTPAPAAFGHLRRGWSPCCRCSAATSCSTRLRPGACFEQVRPVAPRGLSSRRASRRCSTGRRRVRTAAGTTWCFPGAGRGGGAPAVATTRCSARPTTPRPEAALDNVLAHVRDGRTVACDRVKFGAPVAFALRRRPRAARAVVRDFAGSTAWGRLTRGCGLRGQGSGGLGYLGRHVRAGGCSLAAGPWSRADGRPARPRRHPR